MRRTPRTRSWLLAVDRSQGCMEGVASPPIRAPRAWSPLPYRSATRRTLTWATRSRNSSSIFASTSSCAPRVFRRASQGPQGRVVPFGGARQGPDRRSRTAVQQRRPGRVPRFVGAYHHRQFTVPLCLVGVSRVRGPGIAESRSVVSRVTS